MEPIQITLPSSKSLSNRWLVMDYLSRNGIKIKNLSTAEDTQILKRMLRQLKMGRRHNYDVHDSGTAARFLTALLAVTPGSHSLTGSERLCQRPMAPLIESLRSIGCNIKCTKNEGCLPLKIEGFVPFANRIVIDGSLSSQFASSLLLAASAMPHGLQVELTGNPVSEPYIDMTLAVFDQAGVPYVLKGNPPAYYVEHTIPNCDAVTIEKDWSAASYFYAITALKKDIRLHMAGLTFDSLQGDSVVTELFNKLGVKSEMVGMAIEIEQGEPVVDKFEYNFTDTPDLFPSVAVTCAALGLEARLTGLFHQRVKESDRLNAVATELKKMGCKLEVTEEGLMLHPSKLNPTEPIPSYNDHRIAMAFSILKAQFPNLVIEDPDVVSKSFPTFWEMLERCIS